jgi:hypothetical protein
MLRARGIPVVGIDPTEELLAAAKRRDSSAVVFRQAFDEQGDRAG